MHKTVIGALSSALLFATAAVAADQAAKPTDPQIAHIAYTAGQIDIEAAKQALDKSKNNDVRAFAQQMVGDHTTVNNQALALVKKLNVKPEDNPTSQSLTKQAEATLSKLASLNGAAFDKAYMDLIHLDQLEQRSVWWITRAKENMQYRVVKRRLKKPEGTILRDDEIVYTGTVSRRRYPGRLRRIVALVEVDGVEQEMVFLTNNVEWAPSSVAQLYRCRWEIEVFFKQIKQTLQLADFLGNSANAVRWQLWIALLTYVLLRYQAFLSKWAGSFLRLWAVIRSGLWLKLDLVALLKSYGTAGGQFRLLGRPEQAYLPGFYPVAMG